ncbi:MAG: ABC transporter ATP-binding protein [Treponema sp.]|jgi:oligopeptide/dipeptide ABC transporter ATP-binding protein|nr:ABC transporter ATP-binding protein [Treponema sp.]
MGTLLEVRHLSTGVRRGTDMFTAVDGISFHIEEGEILALVGDSGCGKSLTCLSIPALLAPGVERFGGEILFKGRDLTGLSPEEMGRLRGKEISMIFQEPAASLNPLHRIGPQIAEPLELHGLKDKKTIRAEVLDIMARLGLPEPEKLIKAYPHELSGGMCQRVMIAIAAICRPALLLADEPATALDTAAQAQILELLRKINRDFGTAVLFVSHDLDLVSRICSRALVMYAGKIVESGGTSDLFSRPAHPYTRSLIGAIPQREQKGKPLANIPGRVPPIEEPRRGCPFAPRCALAEQRCAAAFPAPINLGGDHWVYCPRAADKLP